MEPIVKWLIDIPDYLTSFFRWLGPLSARIVVGWTFMWSGWEKLHALPDMIKNFTEWGIPYPEILTPFASGAEFVCGALLLVGLFTRIAAPALVIVMIVAIVSAKADQINSLESFLNLDETAYLGIFAWLGISGPGKASLDYLLQRMTGSKQGDESETLTALPA